MTNSVFEEALEIASTIAPTPQFNASSKQPGTTAFSGLLPLLEFKNATKRFGNSVTFEEVNFSVAPGEFVVVVGKPSSGRPAVLQCATNLKEHSLGKVYFAGSNTNHLHGREIRKARQCVASLAKHQILDPRKTALQNVLLSSANKSLFGMLFGRFTKEETRIAMDCLAIVGMTACATKQTSWLSTECRQRIGIARALYQDPKLIVANEPTANLKSDSRHNILRLLKSIAQDHNISCLIGLEKVDLALEYADRIVVMNEGRVAFVGVPEKFTPDLAQEILGAEAALQVTNFNRWKTFVGQGPFSQLGFNNSQRNRILDAASGFKNTIEVESFSSIDELRMLFSDEDFKFIEEELGDRVFA